MVTAIDRKGCTLRGLLLSFVFIPVGILLCSTSVYVMVDFSCKGDASLWLVDYPNSERVDQIYTGVRPFGLGATIRVLRSPDSRNVVWRWYMDRNQELSYQGHTSANSFTRVNIQVSTIVGGEGGSRIELTSECHEELVFW